MSTDGRVAVAYGDPDTTSDVAVCVSGLESSAAKLDQLGVPVGGRVAIIDFRLDSPTGPPREHRIAPKVVAEEMTLAGFALAGIGTAWVRITNLAILFVFLALGLNIVVGFAGLLDLGYIAFYAVGAYVYALLASPHFNLHLPFWVILPLGALAACVFGVLLGAPTLKLRGDYLAIVTLGFGEIIRIFLNNLSQPVNITNGPQGLYLIDPYEVSSLAPFWALPGLASHRITVAPSAAHLIRSRASPVLGKAMISRMLGSPARSMTRRSSPSATPEAGGINASASSNSSSIG